MNNRARGSNDSQQSPKTAKEVIAANVQSLIEQLEAGHSDALTAYLNAMGRFHNYSFGNILEIARQSGYHSRCWHVCVEPTRTQSQKGGEAESIAFVIVKAVGLEAGTASADYIHLYRSNASLLAQSLEVIQQSSAVILAALNPPLTNDTEELTASEAPNELAEVA